MSGTTPGVVHDQNIDILNLYLLHILAKIFNSNIILFIVTIVPLTFLSLFLSVFLSRMFLKVVVNITHQITHLNQ